MSCIWRGNFKMTDFFLKDNRLGILLPHLDKEWHEYSEDIQQHILLKWEKIRGQIPDRIQDLEHTINRKQAQLNEEDDFARSCRLNSEIAELASVINDLWIWYRINQNVAKKIHH